MRLEGRDDVRATCAGSELELALKVGLEARLCGREHQGPAALAVTSPRVAASAIAPGFWPAGPTFRVQAPGTLRVAFLTERYTMRPGQRPVLVVLDPRQVRVHEAHFEAQRFTATLREARDARLQFGLLPAPSTGDGGARSAAP